MGPEQLLAEYAETGSEAAFRELVDRYVNLVYSAAFRLVNNDAHLAEDVTQTVFADLARTARKLSKDVMLGGWLHRHTCFVASNIMRGERRRQNRERQAVEMNTIEDHDEANLAAIKPVLDETINELQAEDRAAILLRFFEQKDFRSVGSALGSNEDAARKRVDRALEKLHSLLTRRGIILSATALAGALTSEAVTAAPAGLAWTVSTAALATAAVSGGTTLTFIKIMSMTKLQVGIAAVVVAAVAIPLAMEHQSNSKLKQENASLQKQVAQVNARLAELSAESDRMSNQLAEANGRLAAATTNEQFRETLKLRGEVGRLKTAANAPKPSPLSGVISDPQIRKTIREQQKAGMGMIYETFAKRAKLTADQKEKFVDLLADSIMENVDNVTSVLRDGKTPEESDSVFTAIEAALIEKVKDLLGADATGEFQNFTRDLTSFLTAEQFKPQLTGDKAAKDTKYKQLYDLMRQETQASLAAAGLPDTFQTLPILNFRNIASEQEAEKNLKLMDDIYQRVAAKADTFLTPAELKGFADFRAKAIQNSRGALAMNRKMMAPATK